MKLSYSNSGSCSFIDLSLCEDKVKNLKYNISKIDREIDNWDCGVEAPYFQNLCEEVAQLELKLFKLEHELEHLDSYY